MAVTRRSPCCNVSVPLSTLVPVVMFAVAQRNSMPGMSASRLAVAAACLFAAACTSGKDEPQAFEGSMAGAFELRCDESDLVEPSEGQEVAGGVVLASTYKAEGAGPEDVKADETGALRRSV